MVAKTTGKIVVGFLLLVFILSFSLASAETYSYDQKIPIKSGSEELGYVQPYQANILGINYAYLKWQRYGFPIGNSFPIALVKGTTTSLTFGINGELLRVKIGEITNLNVELIINQSDIQTELENLDESLPENIEAISKDAEEKTAPVINEINSELNKLNNDLVLRANKVISRNYRSSLHIINTSNSKLKEMSDKIKEKESELAEAIEDSVIAAVLNIFLTPGSGMGYKAFISQIPGEIRHDITSFLYNIDSTPDKSNEGSFADKGVTTIYLGNPNENKVSAQFNNQLKQLSLPHFEDNKIVGKRTYSSEDIGLIAAIPEEKYWDETTLQKRWDSDTIRLYKTEIAGIGTEGLETSVLWYNDQLELAKDAISGVVNLAGGAADEQGPELNELLSEIGRNANNNPDAAIGFATIAQGWILTAISSLQQPNFRKVDSLGYVVIVQKQGNSYKILETHSIIGDKTQVFLGDYEEPIQETPALTEEVEGLQEANQEEIKSGVDSQSSLNEITGKAVDVPEQTQVIKEEVEESGNFITNFFKKIWGWIAG